MIIERLNKTVIAMGALCLAMFAGETMAKATIQSLQPAKEAVVQIGGNATRIVLRGKGLNSLKGVQLMRGREVSQSIVGKLKPGNNNRRIVRLSAKPNTKPGYYNLRLIGKNQTLNVPYRVKFVKQPKLKKTTRPVAAKPRPVARVVKQNPAVPSHPVNNLGVRVIDTQRPNNPAKVDATVGNVSNSSTPDVTGPGDSADGTMSNHKPIDLSTNGKLLPGALGASIGSDMNKAPGLGGRPGDLADVQGGGNGVVSGNFDPYQPESEDIGGTIDGLTNQTHMEPGTTAPSLGDKAGERSDLSAEVLGTAAGIAGIKTGVKVLGGGLAPPLAAMAAGAALGSLGGDAANNIIERATGKKPGEVGKILADATSDVESDAETKAKGDAGRKKGEQAKTEKEKQAAKEKEAQDKRDQEEHIAEQADEDQCSNEGQCTEEDTSADNSDGSDDVSASNRKKDGSDTVRPDPNNNMTSGGTQESAQNRAYREQSTKMVDQYAKSKPTADEIEQRVVSGAQSRIGTRIQFGEDGQTVGQGQGGSEGSGNGLDRPTGAGPECIDGPNCM